jgi:hypothetical protein
MSETTKEMIEIFERENGVSKTEPMESDVAKVPVYLVYGPRGERLLMGVASYEATETDLVLRMDFSGSKTEIEQAMHTVRSFYVGK